MNDVDESLGERRAKAARDASKWSARDCLMSVIRKIDSGEINPEIMTIGWLGPCNEQGQRTFGSQYVTGSTLESLGLNRLIEEEILNQGRRFM